MATAIKVFLFILTALFPIVDPLSGSPLFLALTKDYSAENRRDLALRVALDGTALRKRCVHLTFETQLKFIPFHESCEPYAFLGPIRVGMLNGNPQQQPVA